MTRPRILWLLLLAACADVTAPPLAEAPTPELAPVLRFVGVCDRPAMWRLSLDDVNLPPSGIWLFRATDSLSFEAVAGIHTVEWSELGQDGWTAQIGKAETDSLGAARVVVTCLPT
jgi:hypothetical protein